MDKLEAMRVFAAVVEGGSFVEASRRLELSAPAVTRSVARLESVLGVKLLHRTTRAVRMTDSGQRYYADVKRILGSVEEAEAAVSGSYSEPQGKLLVTAPVLFGQIYIVPVIADFLLSYENVAVNSVFHDGVANLLEDNLDVAIRIGHLADSSLFATPVGTVRKIMCASPEYLDANGRPEKPSDLAEHSLIQSTTVEPSSTWAFGDKRIKVSPRYQCNQNLAAVKAAELGLGVARIVSYQAADAIDAGTLVPVLKSYEPPSVPINIVYLEGRKANAKIRVFVDFAAKRLRENRLLNPKTK